MSLYFLNLALRFFLEMTAIIGVGMWGWHRADDLTKYLYAIGLPMAMSVVWGVFNVPGDPSRSGSAPVVVPGWLRLMIEAAFFSLGALALISQGYTMLGGVFIVVVVLHYLASVNRVMWLLKLGTRQ
jgi:Protein of unknown function (DUF2568)